MAEDSQAKLLASVKGFFQTGEYSDLTITCGDDTHKVHKVVVCNRAEFFARAVKFGGQETENSTINLEEDEPEIVKLLVQYLYEGEYDPLLPTAGSPATAQASLPEHLSRAPSAHTYTYAFPHTCNYTGQQCYQPSLCPHHVCRQHDFSGSNCGYDCNQFTCEICKPSRRSLNGASDQLLIHAKMYEIADKYEVLGLKDLVKEKFGRACEHFWDHADFAIAAHYAFSTTPENDTGIRDLVSATISKHMKLVKKPEIEVILGQFNRLALGILKQKIIEYGWE